MILQFAGYLVQIVPLIFLFYAPYEQSDMKISKGRILAVLTGVYLIGSAVAALLLLRLHDAPVNRRTISWVANLIFFLDLFGGSVVYVCSFRKETKGKLLFYTLVVEYGMALYIVNEVCTKFCETTMTVPYSVSTIVIYAVTTAVTFPFLYYFLRKINVRELMQLQKQNLYMISGCSVAILAVTVIGLQMEVALGRTAATIQDKICLSVLLICILVANILSYFIYFGCVLLARDKERIQSRLTAYEMQYENVKEAINRERRMRHNLRHHFRTLGVMAADSQLEEVCTYVNEYLKDMDVIEMRQLSRNSVLNTVLSYYIQHAEEQGIQTRCDIQVKEDYPLNMKDMTVLLGNALENALRACESCGEKAQPAICVVIRQYKKSLLIKVENTAP